GLKAYTPKTITDPEKLLEEMDQIRTEGVAYVYEEYTLGICAVGTAIPGLMNSTILISVPVPSSRFYGNEEKFASALLRTVDAIRMRFGVYPDVYRDPAQPDF
ncbi:MAG: IclR family transcriptional regulator C-terminal domain-containing protein, partial [Anaerolineales bacterium]